MSHAIGSSRESNPSRTIRHLRAVPLGHVADCSDIFLLTTLTCYISIRPALGVSVKSVHLVAGRLGLYSQSGHTKDFKNSIRSFRARRSAQAEVRRVLCMCCSSCYVPKQRSIIRD